MLESTEQVTFRLIYKSEALGFIRMALTPVLLVVAFASPPGCMWAAYRGAYRCSSSTDTANGQNLTCRRERMHRSERTLSAVESVYPLLPVCQILSPCSHCICIHLYSRSRCRSNNKGKTDASLLLNKALLSGPSFCFLVCF